jgi:hypothetical protein
LIVSGELPGKKVAGRQRTQANEGSETKAKGGKAGNKRKRQGEATDNESGAGNPGSATQAYCLDADTTTAPVPSTQTTAATNDATESMEAHPTPTIRIPVTSTIIGLQRELHGLKSTVATLRANHDKLVKEVIMLRGGVEVLMALKEDMLVNVPALKAEMRGLRDEMELEMMKAAVVALQHELARSNAIQARDSAVCPGIPAPVTTAPVMTALVMTAPVTTVPAMTAPAMRIGPKVKILHHCHWLCPNPPCLSIQISSGR